MWARCPLPPYPLLMSGGRGLGREGRHSPSCLAAGPGGAVPGRLRGVRCDRRPLPAGDAHRGALLLLFALPPALRWSSEDGAQGDGLRARCPRYVPAADHPRAAVRGAQVRREAWAKARGAMGIQPAAPSFSPSPQDRCGHCLCHQPAHARADGPQCRGCAGDPAQPPGPGLRGAPGEHRVAPHPHTPPGGRDRAGWGLQIPA